MRLIKTGRLKVTETQYANETYSLRLTREAEIENDMALD
jgi:hypothetical protein